MITRETWPENWEKVEPFTPVDEEVYNHFLNTLPPAYWNRTVLQAGEPWTHDEHGALYITFVQVKGVWNFVGFFHAGEIIPVERMKADAEKEKRIV